VFGLPYVAVDFPETSTSSSGCWLLTGDWGVGAEAFSVEPSGAAALDPCSALLGDAGLSGFFEHASPTANSAIAEQTTSVLCSIEQTSLNWIGARWERRF